MSTLPTLLLRFHPRLITSLISGSTLVKRSLVVIFGHQPIARDWFPLHLELDPSEVPCFKYVSQYRRQL